MKFRIRSLLATVFFGVRTVAAAGRAPNDMEEAIRGAVDTTIGPMMAKNTIPGGTVGIVAEGKAYVFNYGVASAENRNAVADDTLFELDSISKTFVALRQD